MKKASAEAVAVKAAAAPTMFSDAAAPTMFSDAAAAETVVSVALAAGVTIFLATLAVVLVELPHGVLGLEAVVDSGPIDEQELFESPGDNSPVSKQLHSFVNHIFRIIYYHFVLKNTYFSIWFAKCTASQLIDRCYEVPVPI